MIDVSSNRLHVLALIAGGEAMFPGILHARLVCSKRLALSYLADSKPVLDRYSLCMD